MQQLTKNSKILPPLLNEVTPVPLQIHYCLTWQISSICLNHLLELTLTIWSQMNTHVCYKRNLTYISPLQNN